jgi:hypothetical protein
MIMKKGAALTRIARLQTTRITALADISNFSHDLDRKQDVNELRSVLGTVEEEITSLRCDIMESNLVEQIELGNVSTAAYEIIIQRQQVALRIQDIKKMLKLSLPIQKDERLDGEWIKSTSPSNLNRGSLLPALNKAEKLARELDEALQEHNWTTDI